MNKTIVTHLSVDLDCITSTWLVRRFFPGWDEAQVVFTPQQVNWNNIVPDSDANILYVDTGYGKFDHHQINEHTCASRRIYTYLLEKNLVEPRLTLALGRLIEYINDVDNFADVNYPDPTADRYDFCLHQLITGLKKTIGKDEEIMQVVYKLLDAALELLKHKTRAEGEIKKGYVFHSKWGKTIAMNTGNDEAVRLSQKMGFELVVIKDPQKGFVRIKTPPNPRLDLTPLYEKIKEKDKTGYWFLHILKNMLLNGSSVTPDVKPSPLTLQQVIEIIKAL